MSTSRLLGCAVALLCTTSTAAWAQDNSAPTPILVPNTLFVTAGALATFDASQSYDSDGDPFTFSWAQILGDPVTLSDSTIAMPTFTAPATAQELQFLLTVTDIFGDHNSLSISAHVSAVPEPAAAWMFGVGVLTLLGAARFRKQSA